MTYSRRRVLAARILLWTAPVIVLGSSLAAGQQVSRWDVFGGGSYLRFDSAPLGFANASNLTGWNAEVAYNLFDALSVVADGSGHYGNQITAYNYMIGPEYSYRWEHSRVFGRVLFGKAQNNVDIVQPTRGGFESVGRAYGGGIGYDRDLNSRFTLRAVQVDYLHTHTFTLNQTDARVSVGVVVHFGRTHKKRRL